MTVIEVNFAKGICAVCKKKTVTHWCDFVIKYSQNTIFVRDYQDFKYLNRYGTQNTTCSLPMCKDCASKQDGDMHLCPHHQKLINNAQLPDKYQRKRAQEERMKCLMDSVE